MVDCFCIKIMNGVDNEFAMKAKTEQVVLEIVVVNGFDEIDEVDEIDGVDRVDESDTIDKHKKIAWS